MTDIDRRLSDSVACFEEVRMEYPVLLNSAPKAGTHLLRNILVHFVGSQCDPEFVMYDSMGRLLPQAQPRLLVGHVPFCPEALERTRGLRQIVLMRDPAELIVALSRAAFEPSDRPDYKYVRENLTLQEYMVMVLTGYSIEGVNVGSFPKFFHEFISGWSARDLLVLDHSEVLRLSEARLAQILAYCGAQLPVDWEARVTAGKKPELSATFIAPLPEGSKQQTLAYARELLNLYAPGVADWYHRRLASIPASVPQGGAATTLKSSKARRSGSIPPKQSPL